MVENVCGKCKKVINGGGFWFSSDGNVYCDECVELDKDGKIWK